MNALILTGLLMLFCAAVVLFLLWCNQEPKCEHRFGAPALVSESDWHEHKFTMPHAALAGKVFHVYRKDKTYRRKCELCGVVTFNDVYDQKPHETDTDVVKPKPGWTPEPAPAPLTFEQLEKLNR